MSVSAIIEGRKITLGRHIDTGGMKCIGAMCNKGRGHTGCSRLGIDGVDCRIDGECSRETTLFRLGESRLSVDRKSVCRKIEYTDIIVIDGIGDIEQLYLEANYDSINELEKYLGYYYYDLVIKQRNEVIKGNEVMHLEISGVYDKKLKLEIDIQNSKLTAYFKD